MGLDISQLTEAASANARGVAGGATKPPATEPASKPKTVARTRSAAAAATAPPASSPPAARTRAQSKATPGRSAANKRRAGTVRLSLDVSEADADAFRAFTKARRHSQETVFRAALQMLLSADRGEYLDIVEALPQE